MRGLLGRLKTQRSGWRVIYLLDKETEPTLTNSGGTLQVGVRLISQVQIKRDRKRGCVRNGWGKKGPGGLTTP